MIHVLDLKFMGLESTIGAFLIETIDGPLLFETGPHSTFTQLEKELGRHGYAVEDVQHVFVTHVHLDHAGAAWAFAKNGAKIYVHPSGLRHLQDPSRLMDSARRIYQDKMDELWGDMNAIPEDLLIVADHGQQFTIGETTITGWHTPGHASHHVAWQFEKKLICGDVGGVRIGNGIVVPPCPPPDINIEDWKTSIQLMLNLDVDELFLTHFGSVKDKEKHLNELEKILLDWANWIKPYFEKGVDPKVVTPLFEAYVNEQLFASKIEEIVMEQYAFANPAWMSVYGLMRYWSKHQIKNGE